MGKHTRTRSRRSTAVALLAAVALAIACQSDDAASPSHQAAPSPPRSSAAEERSIERAPWDAARVEELTSRLAKQMMALRQSVRLEPSLQDVSGMQSKRGAQLMDTLRVIELSARQLSARVAGGGGLEETRPIMQKIGVSLRDARVDARQLMLTAPTLDVIEEARVTLEGLSPFYGIQLLPVEPSGAPPVAPAE
jgi:hypothetical protein